MSYSNEEILAGLVEIINEETSLPAETIELGKSLQDDLDIDSLSMLTIMTDAEKKFGMRFDDNASSSLSTVGDVVDYIAKTQA
jgi:acyl carrier protein